MKVFKIIAKGISVLAYPAFMSLYGVMILYKLGLHDHFPGEYSIWLYPELRKWTLLVISINTIFVPLSLFPFYLHRGIISGIRMEKQTDRIIPLIIQLILFLLTYYLLNRFSAPGLICLYILSGAILASFAILISRYWKISLHLLGMGAITGLIFTTALRFHVNATNFLLLLIVISGLTASSRLILGDHKPSQVYAGFISGFVITAMLIALA